MVQQLYAGAALPVGRVGVGAGGGILELAIAIRPAGRIRRLAGGSRPFSLGVAAMTVTERSELEPIHWEPRPSTLGAPGGVWFDWLMVILSGWLIGGLYLDGWAHIHVPSLETFFTPWHAVLYSGFLAIAGTLAVVLVRNRRRGTAWRRALPVGYGLSMVGTALFLVSGLGDMVWHILFGIEDGVEGLVSPTHLALALGGGMMVTGPLRAALRRAETPAERWLARLPMVLSLTVLLSLLTFFTEYASPVGTTWVAENPHSAGAAAVFVYQAIGLASFLVQSALLMGLVLYVIPRRRLPLGSFTVVLSINTALMAVIHDKYLATGPYPLIAAAVLAGVSADILYWWLAPSALRVAALRVFAFAMPAIVTLFYCLAVMLRAEIWWTVHLWTGAVVLAGGVGWLLSYLVAPPPGSVTRDHP